MSKRLKRILAVAVPMGVGMILCQSTAFADSVTMELAGTPAGSAGGVYTSPYQITVNGTTTLLLACDDFTTDIYSGDPWNANVYTFSSPTGVTAPEDQNLKFYNSSGITVYDTNGSSLGSYSSDVVYNAAAYLAWQVFSDWMPAGTQASKDQSYALWQLFDKNAYLSFTDPAVHNDLVGALAYANNPSNPKLSVTIYTPCTPAGANCATDRDIGTGGPPKAQEFLSVSAPEASVPAILAFDLFAVAVFLLRRRIAGVRAS